MTEAGSDSNCDLIVQDNAPGIRKLVLNRPDRLNAVNESLWRNLHQALCDCRDDEGVRAVGITGRGRGFCAGQDLGDRDPRNLNQPLDLGALQKELTHPVIRLLREMEKPIVMSVNGIAAGAGSSLALAGDIVIAAKSATFVQSFSNVGLSVDAGGGWQLVQALGVARARGLLLTGGMLSAEEAVRTGMIWKCVNDIDLEKETEALLVELATGPTRAYAAIKSAIVAAETSDNFNAYLMAEAELQTGAGLTEDYREGVLSFIEKRAARFRGK